MVLKYLSRHFSWKTPMLQARHVRACVTFAKHPLDKNSHFWSSLLWSDEISEIIGHKDVAFVKKILKLLFFACIVSKNQKHVHEHLYFHA